MEDKIKEEVRQGAGFAALSYVFFLCIFVLIYKKDNEFARYHAKQALVLFIGWVVCLLFSAVVPLIGFIFSVFGTFIYLICLTVGIFSGLMGIKLKFPLISQIADKMVI